MKIRFYKIIILEVLIVLSTELFSGCMPEIINVEETVKQYLSEKYNIEFEISHLGNRIDTGSATLYCYPAGNQRAVFTAVRENSSGDITDDYPIRLASSQFDSDAEKRFTDAGAETATLTILYGGTSLSKPADNHTDYMKKAGTTKLYIDAAVNAALISDEANAQKWIDTLKDISKDNGNILMITAVYFIKENDYQNCRDNLVTVPEVNNGWFGQFDLISKKVVKCSGDEIDITAKELSSCVKE